MPVPICVDIPNVNMNPVNFHTFVTASSAFTEASHSCPPSWSCWESLDLWQCRLFPGLVLGCQKWGSSFVAVSNREESQAERFSLINPCCHPNSLATAVENRESKTDGRGKVFWRNTQIGRRVLLVNHCFPAHSVPWHGFLDKHIPVVWSGLSAWFDACSFNQNHRRGNYQWFLMCTKCTCYNYLYFASCVYLESI